MISRTFLLSALEIFCISALTAQPYPSLTTINVQAIVSHNAQPTMYLYAYNLTNPATNNGSISKFCVNISRNLGSVEYDTVGLRFAGNDFMESDFRQYFPIGGQSIVPLGFQSLPPQWLAIWGNLPEATVFKDTNFIQPGQSVSGIVLMSKYPPGLRNCIVEPDFVPERYFPSMDDPSNTFTLDQIDSIRDGLNYYGFTVGPWAPSSNFMPLVFLDTLSSFVSESRALSWIPSQTTTDMYSNLFVHLKSDIAQFNLKAAGTRIDTVLQHVIIDSASNITSEAYALIRYNTEYLRTQLQPSNQVKAGVFFPSASTLSVKAKPSTNFGSSDSLKTIIVTLRWLTSSTVSLGTISSPVYGFVKQGSVTNSGGYSYQIFKTTIQRTLSWNANTEYELFTIPVTGMNGSESFELSNALSGGEWFVDINYLDKTDSVSYAPVAQGYAYSNKSDYLYSTVYNGSRHVSMTTTKFHEGYSSGGEIIYRRKSLTGSWETTQRISAGDGNSNDPFVLNAHDGSIHIVWQKYLTSTSYRLLYSRSTNGGTTWIGPTTLISSVPINSAQYNIYPVLAEWNSSKLVLVYCVNTGLKYLTSSNLGMNWTGPTSISGSGGSYAGSIWFPSLSSGPGYVILTYDTRYSGVFSHAYNGTSWLTEASVNAGTGTRFDRYSSVAYDPGSGAVYASWCAQGPELAEYMILTRSGTSYGAWGRGFVQFAKTPGASNLYPSITPWQEPGVSRNIDIIYQNTINQVKLNQYFEASGWQSPRLLSSSGQWANIPQITDMSTTLYPIRIWTDQTASPYQVVLSTDGSYPLNANISEWAPAAEPFNRRVVIESDRTGATISFELKPIRVVTSSRDTVVVPFKRLDLKKPFTATIADVWDYLGTETAPLPPNARTVILDPEVKAYARQDSLRKSPGLNVFSSASYRLEAVKGVTINSILSDSLGTSVARQVDISQYGGQTLRLRLIGIVPAAETEQVSVGVGDIYP